MSASPAAPETTRRAGIFDLRGGSPALVWDDAGPESVLSYDDLGNRVDAWALRHLGATRRLVLLECDNSLDSVIAYLAVVQHGHVAIVAPPLEEGRRADLVQRYDPDVVVRGGSVDTRRVGSAHAPHPDLALMLSTSGSTGSPRMVRLSRDAVRSNAEAIASYLELTSDDVAITSLPLHYCYGLSVLHSHLVAGASVALTAASVVDTCFWDLVDRASVTSLAAVPHTVDLLEHSGFAQREVPSLRRITQAGGRLAPDRVRELARLGVRRGFDLVVMYGQTEATARMAWLPPSLAARHPDAVGRAIPDGRLDIEHPGPDGVGEIVYSGPNVMMGYADSAADLSRDHEHRVLRTGDLGRIDADGLLRVTGRANRTVKLFGLRLDLDRVERHLAADGSVRCVVDATTLHVFGPGDVVGDLPTAAAAFCGLPLSVVRSHPVEELPLTTSGKVDYAALARMALPAERPASCDLLEEYASVLGRPDATADDSFVSLGGDSLSYVELATRLEARLGRLPLDWHLTTISELGAAGTSPDRSGSKRRSRTVETSIALRAGAIVAVVASHVDLITLEGGAHLLLVLAGWNFARFQLGSPRRRERLRHGLSSLAQLVVPSVLWIGGVALVAGTYDLSTVFFVHRWAGGGGWDDNWQFWFLQALVWCCLGGLAVISVPALHRLERRAPWGFALALLAVAAVVRLAWVGLHAGPTERYTTGVVVFFFALGWAGERSRTPTRRLLVMGLATALTAGFFGQPLREVLVLAGFALMMWVPTTRLPALVARSAHVLAASSLFIYLTHWQVYPLLEDSGHRWLALWASIALGIAYGVLVAPLQRILRRWMRPGRAEDCDGPRLPPYPQQLRSNGVVEDPSPAESPGRQPR